MARIRGPSASQSVEQVDLAPTFCKSACVDPAPWMQGRALPLREDGTRERAPGMPNGLEKSWPQFAGVTTRVKYDGSELYDLANDPLQWEISGTSPGGRP
jgi:hypothetical protein